MYPLGVMIGATPHPKDPDRVDELKEYFDLVDRNLYNPHNSNRIISNQKAHSNALKRRGDVQQFLKERYGDLVDTRYNLRQSDLWKGVSDCLVAVAVPGATVNCTDRWHIQLFGLGVCMITAVLGVCFTWFKKPQPWIHYVPCKPNFEDLGDRIEWCRNNRDKCLEIGNNAATLFQECYSLESYWGWVEYILNQHY
jgi:hypothetical protein